jgi:uncharacterized membrane protein
MSKSRLEAFSDGVIAVIITILVLELKLPQGATLDSLETVLPGFFSYVLSFVYVGIYWNNHHHLLHATQHVTGAILWANLHLLFWLSLTPFATAWMAANHFAALPVALYGLVLLFAGVAYFILTKALIAHHGKDSMLASAIGKDRKGTISLAVYVAGIALSFWRPWVGFSCYVAVAIMWLLPDPRIERNVRKHKEGAGSEPGG